MKICSSFLLLILTFTSAVAQPVLNTVECIPGKWVRITPVGPVGLEFKSDGLVEADFGKDGSTDVISWFTIKGDTITFSDREGEMCRGAGSYKIECNDYYLAFDLVDDMCKGRVKMTMGYWTRPDFNEMLDDLSAKLEKTGNAGLNLTRARIFLATGNIINARSELDEYIRNDISNARAYINRAGTWFPGDLKNVISDCDRAILLEPDNKNAWFLRGLANYELGNKEKACADFMQAIRLGFTILQVAEAERCRDFWNAKK